MNPSIPACALLNPHDLLVVKDMAKEVSFDYYETFYYTLSMLQFITDLRVLEGYVGRKAVIIAAWGMIAALVMIPLIGSIYIFQLVLALTERFGDSSREIFGSTVILVAFVAIGVLATAYLHQYVWGFRRELREIRKRLDRIESGPENVVTMEQDDASTAGV